MKRRENEPKQAGGLCAQTEPGSADEAARSLCPAEPSPRQSEERYRTILQMALDGFWLANLEGQLLEVNESYCRMSGYTARELLTMRICELEAGEAEAATAAHLQTVMKRGQDRFESTHRRKDGSFFEVEVSVQLHPFQGGRLVAFLRDIGERKREREALRLSEEMYRTVVENAGEAIIVVQKDMLTFVNAKAATMSGYSREELRAMRFIDFIHPEDRAMVLDRYSKRLRRVETPSAYSFRMVRRSGELLWVALNVVRIDWKGESGTLNFLSDITERKQAEETLRQTDMLLKESQVIAGLGSYVLDIATGWWRSSDVLDDLFGIDQSYERSVAGWAALIHPDDRTMMLEHFRNEVLAQGRTFDKEYRIIRHGSQVERWVHGLGKLEFDAQGRPLKMFGTIQDITQRKRAELERVRLQAQVQQAQKMQSVGQLAGGVAHDFNNMLAAMMMHLSLLEGNPSLDSETQGSLNELMVIAKRAANLTRQLLAFSRQSVFEPRVLDLNQLAAAQVKMLGRLLGEQISLQFEPYNGLPHVNADAGMLEQVLMNLAVNARDAMSQGGRLTIRLEPIMAHEARIRGNLEVPPGPFVCLSVADTGCGMDAATRQRLFEPFFTTKEVGKGTGLGLATVDGIIAQHQGWVEVESVLGKGSLFKVFLPATTQKATTPRATEASAAIRGRETILLAEDEASLRRVVGQVLRRLGYLVLEAADGQAAMTLWQKHGGNIDLLFSDMVMPEGLNGMELALKLKELKPGLKVLLSSGYHAETAGQGSPATGGIMYLQKPYPIGVMSRTVRECLDQK